VDVAREVAVPDEWVDDVERPAEDSGGRTHAERPPNEHVQPEATDEYRQQQKELLRRGCPDLA
jgi:hypothetical protein